MFPEHKRTRFSALAQEKQAYALLQQKIPHLEQRLTATQKRLIGLQSTHQKILDQTETTRKDNSLQLSQELTQVATNMSSTVHNVKDIIDQLQSFLDQAKQDQSDNPDKNGP